MGKLIAIFAHWFGRQILSLLLITLVLVIGVKLYSAVQEYVGIRNQIGALEKEQGKLPTTQDEIEKETRERINDVNLKSQQAIDRQITNIDKRIHELESKRRSEIVRKLAYLKGDFAQDIELELRIEMLRQEREYMDKAKAAINSAAAIAEGQAALSRLDNDRKALGTLLRQNVAQQDHLRENYPVRHRVPFTDAYQDLKHLQAQHKQIQNQKQHADSTHQAQLQHLAQLNKLKSLGPFNPVRDAYETESRLLRQRLDGKKAELESAWIHEYVNPAYEALPTALMILAGTILSPWLIKGLFFYVVAPIASRRPTIRLSKSTDGLVNTQSPESFGRNHSAISLAVIVGSDEELLVHPEYIRNFGTSDAKTQWLLSKKYPFMSIAAGLYGLTQLRSNETHTHVISAMDNPLAEVAVLEIPAGSSLVLQPRNIIGVIQRQAEPLRIESAWRLGTLTAWLTLQLRYLVFSGPARILVKGCRGVRVDPVGDGQRINQASTMGFSANLEYSVGRSATFMAYMWGNQELLDDKFVGQTGYVISEEMPYRGDKKSMFGRGLEGFLDSAFKIFGV